MWEVELNNKQAPFKLVDKVGSRDDWYNKANQYWEVSFRPKVSKLIHHMMEFLEAMEASRHLIPIIHSESF